MIRVRITSDKGTSVVEFYGVRIKQPDGSRRVPVGEKERSIHVVSGRDPGGDVVNRVWSQLELGHGVGNGDGFDWKVEGN
jgi:hypothetical protein